MKLFSKSRAENFSPKQEQLAGRIAGRITAAQRRAATWLNGKTSGVSAKTWLVLLMLFCAAFGSYCLHLLIMALN